MDDEKQRLRERIKVVDAVKKKCDLIMKDRDSLEINDFSLVRTKHWGIRINPGERHLVGATDEEVEAILKEPDDRYVDPKYNPFIKTK